jgi:hypothetical protein
MKKTTMKWLIVVLSVTAFLMMTGMMIAKDSVSVSLEDQVAINGTKLAGGQYSVSWSPGSSGVTVTFLQNKKPVANAKAKLVDRDKKFDANQVVYRMNNDGSRSILEIRVGGTKQALVFGE